MEELRHTSTQLNHAVHGLNELMEEALLIAGQAAQNGRPEDIAAIFDDATAHFRQAKTMQKQRTRRRHHSTDELHNISHASDYLREGTLPAAPAKVYRYGRPAHRHARPRPDDPVELHHLGLPPVLRQRRPDVGGQQGLRARVSNTPDRQPPLPPVVQQVPPRISSRPTPSTEPRSSTATSHGTSNATTESPDNIDLEHPRKRHVSLRPGQEISLGRHHHRQPIAREWQTVRKRITATIACLNTVFIGLIVGIYVSCPMPLHTGFALLTICRLAKYLASSIKSRTQTTVSFWAMFCKHGFPRVPNHSLTSPGCISASLRRLFSSGRCRCSMAARRTLWQLSL